MAPYCTCHPHYGCCDPQHSRGEQAVNSTPASARRWCLLTPATLQVQALHVRIVQFGSLGVLNTVNRAPSNDTNLFSIGKINKLQRLLCKDAHLHSLKTHVVNALYGKLHALQSGPWGLIQREGPSKVATWYFCIEDGNAEASSWLGVLLTA